MKRQVQKWQIHLFRISTWILHVCLLSVIVACGAPQSANRPVQVRIPWPDAAGSYSFQSVPLHTLTSLDHLSGSAAEIWVDPSISENSISGEKPLFRFIDLGSRVYVPQDYTSLQMATTYAHLERLEELDRAVGTEGWLSRPRKVGLFSETTVNSGGEKQVDNGLYYAPLDTIFIVPYTSTQLPMTMNGGILAHEYFHALFQSKVLSSLGALGVSASHELKPPDVKGEVKSSPGTVKGGTKRKFKGANKEMSDGELTDMVILRGINEGLADFWGWVYSGDENFFVHSLPEKVGVLRRLDQKPRRLPTMGMIEAMVRNSDEERDAFSVSYSIGTEIARFFRILAVQEVLQDKPFSKETDVVKTPAEIRTKIAIRLVNSFSRLKTSLKASVEKKERINPLQIISAYFDQNDRTPNDNDYTCEAARSLLAAPGEVNVNLLLRICKTAFAN